MRLLPPLLAGLLTAATLPALAGPAASPPPPPPPLSPPPPPPDRAPAAAADATATTAPLRPSAIAGDAVFVVHVDLEALRRGVVFVFDSEEIEQAIDTEEERQAWRHLRPLLEQTLSVTLYGNRFEDRHTVLLIRTRASVDEFFDAIAAQGEAPRLVEEGGRTLRVWGTHEGDIFAYADPRPAPGEPRTVVAAQSRREFDAAVSIIDGRGGSLETAGTALAEIARPRPGAVLFAAITDLEPLRKHERAAVLRNAERLRVELGEHAGSAFAEVAVTTPTEDAARQMADVCRGLIAMGQMLLAGEPEYAGTRELLSSLNILTEGRTTTISLACSTDKIVDAVRSAYADRPMSKKIETEPAHASPASTPSPENPRR